MKLLIACLLVSLLTPTQSWAQPTAAAEAPSAALEHNGVKGRWFSMPSARKLLKAYKLLPVREQELKASRDLLDLQKVRTTLLEANLKDSQKIVILWKETAAEQAKAAQQKDSFWKSPYLWVGVGFVLGAGTAIAATYASR